VGTRSVYPKAWRWYVPTAWTKGTAWFVREAKSADSKYGYLLTAGHNVVSRTSENVDDNGAFFRLEPEEGGVNKVKVFQA